MDDALIEREYTRMALVYEERVVPRFAPIAAHTVELARLREGERVLDVGCGTGLAALLAAERVGPRGEVVGLDVSEGQLGIATGKAALRGVANVTFVRADATHLSYSEEFDAVLSNLGVPPAFDEAFAGMRRALKPGGRASVTEWWRVESPMFDRFRALLAARAVADPPAELAGLRRVAASRRERFASIETPEGLRGALEKAGFAKVQVEPRSYEVRFATGRAVYDFMTSWGATEHEVRALPGPEREALLKEVEAAFGREGFTTTWNLLHAEASR